MTGKGIQILVEACLVMIHEVYQWIQRPKGSQSEKSQKDVPKG
jgi:hypothetical protein